MNIIAKLQRRKFLFEELVKRDFKEKYKRTVIGVGWSILSPLLNLLVMKLVFTQFFGRDTPHYTIYLFSGTLVFSFFKEATKGGMGALMANAKVFTKINVPKYLFVLTKNISSIANFLLTLVVYFVFCAFDGITFSWKLLLLVYPIVCLLVFNIGVGLILSAMYIFFKDTTYLYDVFLTLLHYLSAIFYRLDGYEQNIQNLFLLNPVYCYIRYFRMVVIDGVAPGLGFHALLLGYALAAVLIGSLIYKKKNHEFLYYL